YGVERNRGAAPSSRNALGAVGPVAALELDAAATPAGVVATDLARLAVGRGGGAGGSVGARAGARRRGGAAGALHALGGGLDDVAHRRATDARGDGRQARRGGGGGGTGRGDLLRRHLRARRVGAAGGGRLGLGRGRRGLGGLDRGELDLDVGEQADDLALDLVGQLLEGAEGLLLVLDEGVDLRVGLQSDALAQVVHLGEVGDPLAVDHLQHQRALDRAHDLLAVLLLALLVRGDD